MANISSFWGEATFPKSCEKELRAFIKDYTAPYYGVTEFFEPVNGTDCLHVTFFGAGRWKASSLFEADGRFFFYPDENPHAEALMKAIEGQEVDISYTDHERGNHILYEFMGYIAVENGKVNIIGDCNDLDYSSRHLCELGVEDIAYDAKEDFEEIVKFVVSETVFEDSEELRRAIRNEINKPLHDGILTEDDCYDFPWEVEMRMNDGQFLS